MHHMPKFMGHDTGQLIVAFNRLEQTMIDDNNAARTGKGIHFFILIGKETKLIGGLIKTFDEPVTNSLYSLGIGTAILPLVDIGDELANLPFHSRINPIYRRIDHGTKAEIADQRNENKTKGNLRPVNFLVALVPTSLMVELIGLPGQSGPFGIKSQRGENFALLKDKSIGGIKGLHLDAILVLPGQLHLRLAIIQLKGCILALPLGKHPKPVRLYLHLHSHRLGRILPVEPGIKESGSHFSRRWTARNVLPRPRRPPGCGSEHKPDRDR